MVKNESYLEKQPWNRSRRENLNFSGSNRLSRLHATLTTLCTQQTPRWPMVSGPGLCQHPGRDRTGPKRTGPKGTGPKRTGPKGPGPKRTGPDRPNRAGPARWRWCHRHLLLGLGTRMNCVILYSNLNSGRPGKWIMLVVCIQCAALEDSSL
jgi:hypothetical protein